MKLIVLAAGKGTRFLPLTNTIPKGMVPLLGKPLLEHAIAPYLKYVKEIIFVISEPLGIKIKDYFKEKYLGHDIFYVTQKEQKGTMNAVFSCREIINENELFCVCNGDDLMDERDIKEAMKKNTIGIGISQKIMPKNYLGIETKNGYISGFKRHEGEKDFVEGVYYNGFNILNKRVFDFKPEQAKDGEYGLPHTLFANLESYPLEAFNFKKWETVNKPEDVKNAETFIKER